jgi:hypothetical protein
MVVPGHDERDFQALRKNGGCEIAADGGAPHASDDDVGGPQVTIIKCEGISAREALAALLGEVLGHLEHPLGVARA